VLREIGAADRPTIAVLNKADQLPAGRGEALQAARPESVLVSALRRDGLDALRQAVSDRLALAPRPVRLRFRTDEARAIAAVYGAGRVVSHAVDGDDVMIDVEMPERFLPRFRARLVG
jgi:GTP-binding protein HflX